MSDVNATLVRVYFEG